MKQSYILTTDNSCDFDDNYYSEHNLPCVYLTYTIDDKTYGNSDESLSPKEFYDKIRDGAMPQTQQANPETIKSFIEPFLKDGKDVLHVAFSSGLSGTYQSACIAAEELREEYPDRKIIIIDSLCASAGQGLLLHEAVLRRDAGMSMDELARWIEVNKLNLVHDVVAHDLFHLQRGGRVSKTAAIVGTALGIKPAIYLNNEGKLVPYSKIRGKKIALNLMADRLAKNIALDVSENIFICHSDVPNEASELEAMVEERIGKKVAKTVYIGPVIGSHTGVGTVALFYFSRNREVPSMIVK